MFLDHLLAVVLTAFAYDACSDYKVLFAPLAPYIHQSAALACTIVPSVFWHVIYAGASGLLAVACL